MQGNHIIDVSMMGLDGSPRVYDNIHPCITQRLHNEPTMVCSVEYIGTATKLSERSDMKNDLGKIAKQASKQATQNAA